MDKYIHNVYNVFSQLGCQLHNVDYKRMVKAAVWLVRLKPTALKIIGGFFFYDSI